MMLNAEQLLASLKNFLHYKKLLYISLRLSMCVFFFSPFCCKNLFAFDFHVLLSFKKVQFSYFWN